MNRIRRRWWVVLAALYPACIFPLPMPQGTPADAGAVDWTDAVAIIRPGDDAQAILDAHPGKKVAFASGTHHLSGLVVASGTHLVGEPGARIDARGAAEPIFDCKPNLAEGVVIENLELTGSRSRDGYWGGAIDGRSCRGWTVRYCYLHHNSNGMTIGPGWQVEHCSIVDNERYGILGRGVITLPEGTFRAPTEIRNTEVARNGAVAEAAGEYAGGIYFGRYRGFSLINSWVHDNEGTGGLWGGTDNSEVVVRSNLLENNKGNGDVFYQYNWSALFKWNVIRGTRSHQTLYNAGSADVTYEGNAISGQVVNLRHANVGSGDQGEYRSDNVRLLNNDIRFTSWFGWRHNHTCPGFESAGNTLRTDSGQLWLDQQSTSFAGWQAAGFDPDGRLLPLSEGEPSLPPGAVGFTLSHYGPLLD